MSIVKIGLIGAGSIGVRHIMAIDALSDAVLVAIVDPSPAAWKIGTERNIPVFDDADKMLSNGGIDAVIIATRHNMHGKMTLESLKAGKHVLVEKPLSLE